MLAFTLTPNLIAQLRDFNKLITLTHSRMVQLPETTRERIHRYAKISMIGASTRIENALLTDAEVEWIDTTLTADGKPTSFKQEKKHIEDKLSKDRERSIEEVAGCRNLLEIIYNNAKDMLPLTETTIRGLHAELMKYYPKAQHYSGNYKKSPNSVIEVNHSTGETRTVFQTADAGPATDAAMYELINWYNENHLDLAGSLAVACEFTYRFLAIHPFQDGNGRLGRGLFLLLLLQSPDNALAELANYLAIDRQIEKRKSEYYTVLNRCSGGIFQQDPYNYHIEHFFKFMLKVMMATLEDVQIYKEKCDRYDELSESSLKVLECFKEHPEIRLTTKQLHEFTQLPLRTISYCLSVLTNEGFIQRYGKGPATRYQLFF